jgi:hypothetical protein
MHVTGHLVEIDYEGRTLTAREASEGTADIAGTGRAAPLVIRRQDMAYFKLKPANPLLRGKLIINTSDGREYKFNFRRKTFEQFETLYLRLRADG